MRGSRCGTLLGVIAAVSGLTADGAAQLPVSITPAVGVIVPIRSTIRVPDGTSASQETAPAFGARVSLNTSVLFGVEGSAFYTGSNVTGNNGATGGEASMLLFSVRGVYYLTPPVVPLRFYLAAGGAMVVRSGEFYDGWEGTTDYGGNVAVGFRARAGSVGIRVEAENYLYAVNLHSAGGLGTGSRLQSDLVGSVALSIPFGP